MKLKKLSYRVYLLIFLPIFIVIALSGMMIHQEWKTVQEGKTLISLASLGQNISNVVHELQKERGASAVHVGSRGLKFKTEVAQQRKLTDDKRKILKSQLSVFNTKIFGSDFSKNLSEALANLEMLDQKRTDISNLDIKVSESNGYFTKTNLSFLKVISQLALVSTDTRISNSVTPYVAFLQGKERAGQERAVGAGGVALGKFDLPRYRKLVKLQSAQDSFFYTFYSYALASQRETFNIYKQKAEFKKFNGFRKIVLDGGLNGEFQGITAPDWYKAATNRINKMYEVEVKLATNMVNVAKKAENQSIRKLTILSTTIVVLLIAVFLITVIIIRGITNPISTLTDCIMKISNGETDFDIPLQTRADEVGKMSNSLVVLKKNAVKLEEMNKNALNLSKENEQNIKREMLNLADTLDKELNTTVGSLSNKTKQMVETVGSMLSSIKTVSENVGEVAETAKETVSNVDNVAKSTEELSESVNEINGQVTQSTRISQEAVVNADNTSGAVKKLSESAGKISDIISLISDIAEQTNLLALNATIEAARAGEAGKGFAVVASEVKSLATQTTQATDEITSQILEIQRATTEAVKAIEEITVTIKEMDHISVTIASAVEEQSVATKEITSSAQNVAESSRASSQKVTKAGEESQKTSNMADHVGSAVNEIDNNIKSLQVKLGKIVRQSAAGDRRTKKRIIPSEPFSISIECQSGAMEVMLKDLSAEGLTFFQKDGKEIKVNERVTAKLPGLNENLVGEVIDISDDAVRIIYPNNSSVETYIQNWDSKKTQAVA